MGRGLGQNGHTWWSQVSFIWLDERLFCVFFCQSFSAQLYTSMEYCLDVAQSQSQLNTSPLNPGRG